MIIPGFLLAVLLLVAGQINPGPGRETAPPPLSQQAAPTPNAGSSAIAAGARESGGSSATPEYRVAEHKISLLVDGDGCWLIHQAGGKGRESLKFDLYPPCYFLTWQRPPSQGAGSGGLSDGLPIGKIGDPIAWKYRSANGVISVAAIGDPIPADMRSSRLYQSRLQQGYLCASSMQGVLLLGNKARLSKKRENVGILCVELQVEEKDFWLLAHE